MYGIVEIKRSERGVKFVDDYESEAFSDMNINKFVDINSS